MHVTAVVLAAGKSLRIKSEVPKPLIKINSKPLIIFSLDAFNRHPQVKDIIIVASRANIKEIASIVKRYRLGKVREIVLGGETRRGSAENGLKAINSRTGVVLIHDAARPFIQRKMISRVIKAAARSGAAITGVRVKATIKEVTSINIVRKTLDRRDLWEIQTPQGFRQGLILRAFRKSRDPDVTDDAVLVEKLGAKVRVIPGSYNNIKVTTPEDLIIAKAIADKSY
ncbi:MAG: 2-C-methyl-D-erythritol 4-phosphate cytidylyltransferase [Candidatus Omnitrophica bacterium]|nr:2-C-methyl-D-erythritol 4-phosphate cytidylyltransferase [Candidatus Omnitrophota bacterium]